MTEPPFQTPHSTMSPGMSHLTTYSTAFQRPYWDWRVVIVNGEQAGTMGPNAGSRFLGTSSKRGSFFVITRSPRRARNRTMLFLMAMAFLTAEPVNAGGAPKSGDDWWTPRDGTHFVGHRKGGT